MRALLMSALGAVLLLSAPASALPIDPTVLGDLESARDTLLQGLVPSSTVHGYPLISTREMTNADATIALPTEDDWYETAYQDVISTSYFDYPAGSDS